MKNRCFLFTGLQPWDIPIGSNAIDIAREVSKQNKVLYVNSPLDMMTLVKGEKKPEYERRLAVLRRKEAPLRKLSESLWVLDLPFVAWSVNDLPDGWLFDRFNALNSRRIFRYARKIAQELGFSDLIHFIDNDIYRSFYSKEFLEPDLSVYYRRDNLQPFNYWKKHAPRLEPKLIAKSDLVVCNSAQLAAFAHSFNANTHDIGQGLDLSAYDASLTYEHPVLLKSIPRPMIGYIGDITSLRLDPDLMCAVAKKRPDYQFVIIGREDAVFQSHELHQLTNVHFPGSIPKSAVAEHMAAFDVCINPQKMNEITMGNYPRKIDEYLAMGKPVVATKTDMMALFSKHVHLCSTVEEYLDALDKALQETTPQDRAKRIEFAQSHSWTNNVSTIYKHILDTQKIHRHVL